jgi:hypothetical protein
VLWNGIFICDSFKMILDYMCSFIAISVNIEEH